MKIELDLCNKRELLRQQKELQNALSLVDLAIKNLGEAEPVNGTRDLIQRTEAESAASEQVLYTAIPDRFSITHLLGSMERWKARLQLEKWVNNGTAKIVEKGGPGRAAIYEKI